MQRFGSAGLKVNGGLLLVALLLLYLQEIVFGMIFDPLVVPQLAVVLVIFLAFYWPPREGLFLSFLIGLIFDCLAGKLLGPGAALLSLLYVVLAYLSARLYLESLLVRFVCGYLSAHYFLLGYQSLLFFFSGQATGLSLIGQVAPLLTALATAILLPVFKRYFLSRERI